MLRASRLSCHESHRCSPGWPVLCFGILSASPTSASSDWPSFEQSHNPGRSRDFFVYPRLTPSSGEVIAVTPTMSAGC